MDNKGNTTIIILLVLVLVSGFAFGGYYLGEKNCSKNNITSNDTNERVDKEESNEIENDDKEEVEEDIDERFMNIYSMDTKYKSYAYLFNQGILVEVVDYNGELYHIDQVGTSAVEELLSGKIKFKDNKYTYDDESTSYTIVKTGIKSENVSKVYLVSTFSSDGRDVMLVIFKDGTVSEYSYVDTGYVIKDRFKGYKVKEIIDYRCSKNGSEGCESTLYKILLTDGSTKDLK